MKKSVLLLYLLLPLITIAGGFEINTQGQKATGMGGAFSGVANDASALFFNPAAIAFHEQAMFNAGFDVVLPRVSFLSQSEGNVDSENTLMIPFHAYITHHFNNKKLTGGIGIYSPFGTSIEWDAKWPGRYLTQKTKLSTLFLQPTITYRFDEHYAAGIGVIGAAGFTKMHKAFAVNDDILLELAGSGLGYGFNIGGFAHYEVFNFSVNYRSPVKIDINKGDATFSNVPASFIDQQTYTESTSFKSSFKLPSTFTFGIGYFPTERITADIDIGYTTWSDFDGWNIEVNNYPGNDSIFEREYKNTVSFKLGGKYHWSDKWDYRAGFSYSTTPSNQGNIYTDLPGGIAYGLAGGATRYINESLSIDASFLLTSYAQQKEVDNNVNFNGSYKKTVYSIGLGIQYEF